jgi:hypothetical protein
MKIVPRSGLPGVLIALPLPPISRFWFWSTESIASGICSCTFLRYHLHWRDCASTERLER